MTIFYIKMKIRAGGWNFRARGGSFRAAGCSPLLFLFMGNTTESNVWAHILRNLLKPLQKQKSNKMLEAISFPQYV